MKDGDYLYIDNKGVRFKGDWDQCLEDVLDAISPIVPMQNQITGEVRDVGWAKVGPGAKKIVVIDRPVDLFDDTEPEPEEEESFLGMVDRKLADLDTSLQWIKGDPGFWSPSPSWITDQSPEPTNGRHPSSERFHEILGELGELHDQKSIGSGTDTDPLANVRASTDWGIPAWQGSMLRAGDKVKRLQAYAARGELPFEDVDDAFRDLAVYSIIGLVLLEQERATV